jgi:hypothetical protein
MMQAVLARIKSDTTRQTSFALVQRERLSRPPAVLHVACCAQYSQQHVPTLPRSFKNGDVSLSSTAFLDGHCANLKHNNAGPLPCKLKAAIFIIARPHLNSRLVDPINAMRLRMRTLCFATWLALAPLLQPHCLLCRQRSASAACGRTPALLLARLCSCWTTR